MSVRLMMPPGIPVHPYTGIAVICLERGYLLTELNRDSAVIRARSYTIKLHPKLMILQTQFGPWQVMPPSLPNRIVARNKKLRNKGWQLGPALKLIQPVVRAHKEVCELSDDLQSLIQEADGFSAELRAAGIWECDSINIQQGE